MNKAYFAARRHHAWLLRLEGLTFDAIGARLEGFNWKNGERQGLSRERVRQMVYVRGREITRAIKRTRWQWIDDDS